MYIRRRRSSARYTSPWASGESGSRRGSLDHWCGDHSKCKPTEEGETEAICKKPDYKPSKTPLDKDGDAVKALREMFTKYLDNAQKYCDAKRLNMYRHYSSRADLAILVHNEGPEVKTDIEEALGFNPSPWQRKVMALAAKRREKARTHKKMPATMKARAAKKVKKVARGKRVVATASGTASYKGKAANTSVGSTSAQPIDVDSAAVADAPPQYKRAKVDKGYCDCTSKTECGTKHCDFSCKNPNCNH
eukprot:TRINITY_DN16637_c0_g2_i2.p1 TRINITY_DN16637_c0_g2~~TRINITY_DN16637_c0_g2_i2.p1  ORF type:complete len:248 (+),score=49.34 TRINITY_DN16637_c0_g2_i2:273-1016(+)